MGIRIKLPNSTRAGQEVGMEGFLSRKEPWEWIWTLDTLLLWFSSCSSLLLLAHVFYKIPTDPYGNYGCHRWVANPLLMQLEWWPGLSRLPFQNGIPGRRKFNVPSSPSLPHPPPPSVIVDVKSTPFQIFTSCMVHDHAITCSFLFFFLTLGWLTVLQAVGGNSRDSGCFTCKLDKQTWRRKKQW